MKRPNPLIYFVFASLLKVYAFLKGQRVKKNTKIKAPCIILSNHTSFPDFIYTTAAAYPRRVNYLAADKMFYDPVLGFFLRLARAIPKHLYQKDPVATLDALRVIKKGGILGVFPESQISSIGVTLEFGPAIAKMVKKAGVTVYLIKHRNAYLVNPPWTKKTFKGKIETTIDLMFSHEQLVDQSVEEIYNEIIRQLAFNTHEYNEIKKKRFKLNDITNLQSVIFQCPKCHNKNLTSNKTSLICPDCGAVLTYDVYGKLGGHRLDILYRSQEDDIRNQIDNSEDFALESEVSLECYRGKRLIKVGEGKLRLEKTGYR
ncbi:MAG: 1-acyl-sn-glycerol-3-phosphate acyltransferase, partial [Bacilli bacterium]|nr:1-acyl-sn-glycerol-3-phosphate acyltransferase [Bacilli bacterium]